MTRRAGVFVLALALAAVAEVGGEGVAKAQTCDPSRMTGVLCQNPTPVCQGTVVLGLLDDMCEPCTVTAGLVSGETNNCPVQGQACVNGSCITACSGSYDGGSFDGGCPSAEPYCSPTTMGCAQCKANMFKDPFCPPSAPDCNANAVCGCTSSVNDCTAPATCMVGAGVFGAGVCVVTCSNDTGCTSHHCAIDGGPDMDASADGRCVDCFTNGDCSNGEVCNLSANTCVVIALDAGAPIIEDAGDGGGTTVPHDAGSTDGGSAGELDATVHDAGTADGSSESSGPYPPGKVEGGGCSLLAVGAGMSDSPVSPALFGFASLAGLFFLRRSRRHASKGRNAPR